MSFIRSVIWEFALVPPSQVYLMVFCPGEPVWGLSQYVHIILAGILTNDVLHHSLMQATDATNIILVVETILQNEWEAMKGEVG